MTAVRTAGYAALHWQDGNLVWDDYLHHRQHALTAESERLLRWFATWRDLDSCAYLGESWLRIARRLLDEQILLARGSAEHDEEQRMLAHWAGWGPGARYHHFAARTDRDAGFVPVVEDELRSAERARTDPPPPWSTTTAGAALTPLPDPVDPAGWPVPGLADALDTRRSTRQFAQAAVTAAELGTILSNGGAPVRLIEHPHLGTTALRRSPSAGARTPVEISVLVRDVAGISPGVHHYAPTRGGLEFIGPAPDPDVLLPSVGGQPWLAQAPVLLIYHAVLARTAWRYRTRRAYRDILIEVGHVSQTVLLVATGLGLGAVTATAIRDSEIEALIGCDPLAEPVLAVTAVGRPVR